MNAPGRGEGGWHIKRWHLTHTFARPQLWGSKFVATYNTVVSSALLQAYAQQKTSFAAFTPGAIMSPVASVNSDLHILSTYSGVDGAISGSGIALYLGMIVQIMIINAAHDPLRDLGVRYDQRILAKALHFVVGALTLSFWPVISVVRETHPRAHTRAYTRTHTHTHALRSTPGGKASSPRQTSKAAAQGKYQTKCP